MSLNDDENPLNPKDLVFILALAGQIDEHTRLVAKELDKSNHIYLAYAVLDSLSSSYSMFKYFFDIYFAGTADEMHDLMLSPQGIIGIGLESLFLVGFSYFAAKFDKEKENSYKKWLTDAWPYIRDILKALKNAYKGLRSVVSAMNLLGIFDAKDLVLPLGLALGVLGAFNRYIIRKLRDTRKEMMVQNRKFLFAVAKLSSLTAEELAALYDRYGPIQYQSDAARYLGYISSAFGGVIDGLYLYAGVLTLSAFAPQLLLAMASVCLAYTIACIITRVFEEYEFQQKLMLAQTQCLLAIATKQIQTAHAQLQDLLAKKEKSAADLLMIATLKQDLCRLIDHFDAQRDLLKQQSSSGILNSMLIGLKHGLYAYSALSSILFLTSALLTIAGAGFPPALVAATVFAGLVLIAGFIGHALWTQNQRNNTVKNFDERQYQELLLMKEQLQHDENAELLSTEQLNASLKNGLSIESVLVYYFQEWFEVFRSLFSGISKGQKFIDFAGNPLQEAGEDGHFHNTPIMYVLGGLSALLFGLVLALRALARGFGRQNVDTSKELVATPDVAINAPAPTVQGRQAPTICVEDAKTPESGESVQAKNRKDSPKNAPHLLSSCGIFSSQFKIIKRSQSNVELNKLANSESNTALGLA